MIFHVICFNVVIVIIYVGNVLCHPNIKKGKLGGHITFATGVGHKKLLSDTRRIDDDLGSGDDKQKLAGSADDKQQLAGSDTEIKKLAGSEDDIKKLAGSDDEPKQLAGTDTEQKQLAGTDDDQGDINAKLQMNEDQVSEVPTDIEALNHYKYGGSSKDSNKKNCWMSLLKANRYFKELDHLDAKYSGVREDYQTEIGDKFEKQLLSALVFSDGAAERARHQAGGDVTRIPAGLNLGGYCMMRMPSSVLFFHRMKLRNSTRFRVNFLQLDLLNMVLVTRLNLNDLHLLGAYERSNTDYDPSVLFYIPSFGEIQILMKNVNYNIEGRLRLINNRLLIELINSEIITNEILMMYVNKKNETSSPMKIQRHNIAEFISRMKTDLDLWLKDYFNDYLMYYGNFKSSTNNEQFLQYEKEKTVITNEYADHVVESIKRRLREYGATTVKIPEFTIYSVNNMKVSLHDGVLRGLDSLYRKSVATTIKVNKIRKIDAAIAFSKLKVEYQYDVVVGTGLPPLRGTLILAADELSAQMLLSQISKPETVDINFQNIVQSSLESLTVEGPANRVIANFKQMLGHSILAIMSNTLIHSVHMMKSLTRCEPYLHGSGKKISIPDEVVSDQSNNDIYDASPSQDYPECTESESDISVGFSSDQASDILSADEEPSEPSDIIPDEEDPEEALDDNSDDNPDYSSDYDPDDCQSNSLPDTPSEDYNSIEQVPPTDPAMANLHDADPAMANLHDADPAMANLHDADYFLTKNDSVELEVPVKGKIEKMKIKSYNEFKLIKDVRK